MSGCCRAPRSGATTTATRWPRWSASPTTRTRRPRASRATATGRSAPARSCWRPARSSGRWCFPATTGPASCWRAPPSATPTSSACCRATRSPSSPTMTAPIAAAAALQEGRRRDRRDHRRARGGFGSTRTPRHCPPAANFLPAMPSSATEGGKTSPASRCRAFDAATGALSGDPRSIDADCLLVSGGWSPVIHLASQAGAKPQWNDAPAGFPAAGADAELDRRRRLQRQLLHGRGAGRGPCRRPRGRRHGDGPSETLPEVGQPGLRFRSRSGLRDQGQGQGLRRLSSMTSPPKTSASRIARVSSRSST